jgi:hypothetical protein
MFLVGACLQAIRIGSHGDNTLNRLQAGSYILANGSHHERTLEKTNGVRRL